MVAAFDGTYTGIAQVTMDWTDRLHADDCADVTLDPSTNYWIVFSSTEPIAGASGRGPLPHDYYLVRKSGGTSEDAGKQDGWSIGDVTVSRAHAQNDQLGMEPRPRQRRWYQTPPGHRHPRHAQLTRTAPAGGTGHLHSPPAPRPAARAGPRDRAARHLSPPRPVG